MKADSNCWKKPQKINYWESDIDYVMFVDENGNSSKINDILKKMAKNEINDENNRYFTITGCIFEKQEYAKAKIMFNNLKNKYWENGTYLDNKSKQKKYVCFHSREIRRHDKAFNDKIINHQEFTNELSKTLNSTSCKIISVSIDLVAYLQEGYLQNIYEKAFDFLLERYIYATKNSKKGIIMLEARGKVEDKQLLKHIRDIIYNKGRKNITTKELISKISGVYFNPKWNEENSATYLGLEITDLFSYPIHQYIKYKKENPAFEILKHKIDGYPNFINKGLKIFPYKK